MPVFQYPYDFTCTCKTCKSCIKYKEIMEEAAWNVKIRNIRKAYVEKPMEEITKRLRNLSSPNLPNLPRGKCQSRSFIFLIKVESL